jgi:hypothetical protein
MNVDLAVPDLARAFCTRIGLGPNARVQGIIGENGAFGGPGAWPSASINSARFDPRHALPYLAADHPRPPRPHLAPHLPAPNDDPGLGAARSRPIRPRMAANNARGTATSASWKIIARAWCTTLAPILISFPRSVVSLQVWADRGSANCLRKLARL